MLWKGRWEIKQMSKTKQMNRLNGVAPSWKGSEFRWNSQQLKSEVNWNALKVLFLAKSHNLSDLLRHMDRSNTLRDREVARVHSESSHCPVLDSVLGTRQCTRHRIYTLSVPRPRHVHTAQTMSRPCPHTFEAKYAHHSGVDQITAIIVIGMLLNHHCGPIMIAAKPDSCR